MVNNMEVNKINFYTPVTNLGLRLNNQKQEKPSFENNIQTSLYNQKGLNVSFGSLAKGIDKAEETCIQLLRKVRDGKRRKFAEDDIMEIITSIKKTKNPDDKKNIIEEVLTIKDDSTGLRPSNDIIKKLVKLVADKSEDERFALLEYAENDLKTVIEPLNAFIRMPKEKQNGLINILKDINEVNESNFFKTQDAKNETIATLYEHFRELLYVDEELSHNPARAKDLKLQTVGILSDDLKYFINERDKYSNPNAQNKVVKIAHDVLNYFVSNYLR